MKTLITIVLLASIICSNAQIKLNETQNFNVAVTIDPYASLIEEGLCFGVEIEQFRTIYTRLGVTHFSKLQGGYTDIIGAVGVVLSIDRFERTTAYSGGRLGVIIRESANASAGVEVGINHKISDSFMLGVRGCWDYRSDFQFYGAENAMQYSTFIKLAYTWN